MIVVSSIAVVFGAGTATSLAAPSSGGSSPVATAAAAATLTKIAYPNPRRAQLSVYSPAMRKVVRVDVLVPANRTKPHPTLYLLDGIDAGVYTGYRESGWTDQTDVAAFMADKDVNVVLPIGGTAAYYTDWQRDDPILGRNKWETFLADELPPLIDKTFAGNGTNVIGGLSMGATGAMALAVRHPDLYTGVMALSGALDLRSLAAKQAVQGTVLTRGGNPNSMWGQVDDPDWAAHDPAAHVSALRGKTIYVAVGNGTPDLRLGLAGLASPVGGFLESASLASTRDFQVAARRAGVDVTYNFRTGLHSWGYWKQDLHRAWPTLATALRLPR
ncbi:alpha/beta hydrolase [Williamsia sterculiae]|uniref:alpha/beta hydrolase n=1 Tax=Williamsia sterculiae TaxID=1344003 RepID=UPI000970CDEA|nr:alpha/beta hydrolase family protein [Williamsia sterculiae]